MKFSDDQKKYINQTLLIKWEIPDDLILLRDSQVCEIVEKATVRLCEHGFVGKNYEPTNDGLMCESILDILGDL